MTALTKGIAGKEGEISPVDAAAQEEFRQELMRHKGNRPIF